MTGISTDNSLQFELIFADNLQKDKVFTAAIVKKIINGYKEYIKEYSDNKFVYLTIDSDLCKVQKKSTSNDCNESKSSTANYSNSLLFQSIIKHLGNDAQNIDEKYLYYKILSILHGIQITNFATNDLIKMSHLQRNKVNKKHSCFVVPNLDSNYAFGMGDDSKLNEEVGENNPSDIVLPDLYVVQGSLNEEPEEDDDDEDEEELSDLN